MKRVLVTGASGFIGRHCLPILLERDYEVHGVYLENSVPMPNIIWHQADLLDPHDTLALVSEISPSHLLHFAWYAKPGKFWTAVENLAWVEASLGLLRAFTQNNGERAVFAGSCAEYDWRYGYCSESVTPLAPASMYGTCKNALRLLLGSFTEQIGLSFAWGRIFFLFGPHEYEERLVASVTHSLLEGRTALCSHGNQVRDFLYVQDVADAFVSLLDSVVLGPVNIASGKPITLQALVFKIAEIIGADSGLVKLGALEAPINDPALLVAAVERLSAEVGWIPTFSLDRGLEQTISQWRHVLSSRGALT